jgi:hypothetical protein
MCIIKIELTNNRKEQLMLFDKTLKVTVKNVFGNDLIYPYCERSLLDFAILTNSKTLTENAIKWIETLGYNVLK